MNSKWRVAICLVVLAAAVGFVGCKKKETPASNMTAPPSGSTPTVQLTATPTSITAGDQVVLSWRTSGAMSVSIDGIGEVPSAGVKTVTPTESTSYHLVARGDGGSADATARVTVAAPPGATAVANDMSSTNLTEEEAFKASVQDIFFDYDSYDVRETDQASLSKSAAYLAQHPNLKVLIGGYCDERGSNEFNLTLGQSRGDSVKKALVAAGIAGDRVRVVSYGKEKPFCTDSSEECWQQNRRAGFALDR